MAAVTNYKVAGNNYFNQDADVVENFISQYGVNQNKPSVNGGMTEPSTYLQLRTSLRQRKGSALTFTRATTATVTDFEGLVKTVKSGEARFQGGRRVENLLTYSEDFSNAVWQVTGGGLGSLAVKTPNYGIAPDGTQTACRIQVALNGGTTTADYSVIQVSITPKTYQTSTVWIKTSDGTTKTLWLRMGTIQSKVVDGTWRIYNVSGSLGFFGVGIRGAQTPTNSDTADFLIWHPQYEDVTGQSNQNPSEYVSTNVLSTPWHGANVDGVKYFDTTNGNSVVANVVTEATGAPLSTPPALLVEPARTNLCLQSNAFTTTWTAIGTPAATQNQVGLTGAANEAWTLTDNDAGVAEGISQPVTLTAAAYTYSIFIKKTSGATVFPVMEAITGTVTANCTVNTNTGVATVWTAYTGRTMLAGASATCVSHNSLFWRVSLTYTATVAAYTHATYPAATATGNQSTGTIDATQQGSNVFTCAQIELGATASSYIPTTTIAVARNADVATIPTAGNITAAAGSVYVEYTSSTSSAVAFTIDDGTTNNSVEVYNGPSSDFRVTVRSGGTVQADIQFGVRTLNIVSKIAVSWASNSVRVSANGASGTEDVVVTTPATLNRFSIGDRPANPILGTSFVKNLRTFTRQLSQAELNALTR